MDPQTTVSEGGRPNRRMIPFKRGVQKRQIRGESESRAAGGPQAPPVLQASHPHLPPPRGQLPVCAPRGDDTAVPFYNPDVIYKQPLASTKVLESKYSPL